MEAHPLRKKRVAAYARVSTEQDEQQSSYTVDFLTKETKVNNGERKQWYIHDSHDAIISPETFELVQKEIERRCSRKGSYYDSPFTDKVICGDCGGYLRFI